MRERSWAFWREAARHSSEWEAFAQQLAAPLRAPVSADPALVERIMHAVREDARRSAARQPGGWRRPVTVHVTPIRALALAAGLVALYVGADLAATRVPEANTRLVGAARRDTVHTVRFVFVAPGASSVSVVGDFNRWSLGANPLAPAARGVWTTSVQLPRGRHEYVFVIDGQRWVTDPAAPASPTDEFGGESSTIMVGRADSPRAS